MAVVTYVPKCILESEDLVTFSDLGISYEEGSITLGGCKVNCVKVYNLTETQLFDKIDSHALLESTDAMKNSFVQRSITVLFMKLRQAAALKDKDQRVLATCALMGAINALGAVDARAAARFLALVRGIN